MQLADVLSSEERKAREERKQLHQILKKKGQGKKHASVWPFVRMFWFANFLWELLLAELAASEKLKG